MNKSFHYSKYKTIIGSMAGIGTLVHTIVVSKEQRDCINVALGDSWMNVPETCLLTFEKLGTFCQFVHCWASFLSDNGYATHLNSYWKPLGVFAIDLSEIPKETNEE